MWGCVIGLQRETPPLKKKKKASERGDPHLASRLAPPLLKGTGAAARAASVLLFPFLCAFLLLPGRRKQIKKIK